jgi:hypothetical protein
MREKLTLGAGVTSAGATGLTGGLRKWGPKGGAGGLSGSAARAGANDEINSAKMTNGVRRRTMPITKTPH